MSSIPVTRCIFCGGSELTGEHIYSGWTHQLMASRQNAKARASIAATHYIHGDESNIVKLPGNIRDWQVKCVCGKCNNGWMREIENQARPILTDLIKSNDIIIYSKEQRIICAWAALKLMVAEYDNKTPVTVSDSQRKYMYNHKSPPSNGWGIWIGAFEKRDFRAEWICRPLPLVRKKMTAELANVKASHFNTCANTQIIGKLFIHIIHVPVKLKIDRWRFVLPHHGALFRIWPAANTPIKWPSRALDDTDAETAIEAFFLRCSKIVADAVAQARAQNGA